MTPDQKQKRWASFVAGAGVLVSGAGEIQAKPIRPEKAPAPIVKDDPVKQEVKDIIGRIKTQLEIDRLKRPQIQALIKGLGSDSYHEREEASKALRDIGAPAIPALTKAYRDPDPDYEIQVRAWRLVYAYNNRDSTYQNRDSKLLLHLQILNEHLDKIRAKKADDAVPVLKDAIPILRDALTDENPDNIRSEAAYALGLIGPIAKEAAPELIKALEDKNDNVRWKATWALGNMASEAQAAMPQLIKSLKDKNPGTRSAAAWTLGNIGPGAKAALPVLIEALRDDKKEFVRCCAAEALGKLVAKEAVPELVKALDNMNPTYYFVPFYAMEALGKIGPAAKEALPDLRVIGKIEGEYNRELREAARNAIEAIENKKAHSR